MICQWEKALGNGEMGEAMKMQGCPKVPLKLLKVCKSCEKRMVPEPSQCSCVLTLGAKNRLLSTTQGTISQPVTGYVPGTYKDAFKTRNTRRTGQQEMRAFFFFQYFTTV